MSDLHTPSSLADVLERDYFPMPDGAKLYLTEYEWRMVVKALRSSEADQRDAVLEEAARVCEAAALQVGDEYYWTCSKACATAIRALKRRDATSSE